MSSMPIPDPQQAPDEATSAQTEQRVSAGHLALEIMHEIRNPLEVIGHLSYLADQEAESPEQVRTYMRLIEEQIRTLSRITNRTLSYAKLPESRGLVDLVALTESALRIHQRAMEDKHIHLVRKSSGLAVAKVDGPRMLQVLSNLIANALDAMPAKGQLTIRAKKRNGHVELLVADSGHGMQPDVLERLFQPFFTTKEKGGNGLGLSLTKRIVEDHGGKLLVRSTVRPGRSGSIFKIRLPCA